MLQAPPSPLFAQVAETIKTRIQNRTYAPGGTIPSARELEAEMGVSNITIRKAVNLLAAEGLILPRRGARAVVANQSNEVLEIEITSDYQHWVEMATGKKYMVKADILDRETVDCPAPIQALLNLKPGETVERIRRVRKLRGKPIAYYVNFGLASLFSRLPSKEIVNTTMVETFQAHNKGAIATMEQRLHAATADLDFAAILKVDFGFPLFFVQNVYFGVNKSPLFATQMYYRADYFVYTIERDFSHPLNNQEKMNA